MRGLAPAPGGAGSGRLAWRGIASRFRFDTTRFGSVRVLPLVDSLLIVAFVIDVLTPFFVWRGILPDSVSWVSQAAVGVAVAIVYTRMMVLHRIPGAVGPILVVSVIGATVALLGGQGLLPTLWGWWSLFKFPLVGLYAYLRPQWSEQFPQYLLKVCLAIMGFEVLFQAGQYLSGQPIGDNLAGTFGWHGVGPLLFVAIFVVCLALGQWLAEGQWKPLVVALGLGAASSVLAENKMFAIAVVLLALLAVGLAVVRGRQASRVLPFALLAGVGVLLFGVGYNQLVPRAARKPLEQILLDEDTRSYYLSGVRRSSLTETQTYHLGRNSALEYAVSQVSGDSVTLWFGYGLGGRRASQSLGTVGALLREDKFNRGSDLVVMVQEMGLFGVIAVLGFVLWVSVVLYRDIRQGPRSPAAGLRYALLLFSLLWPLWLWYKRPMSARAAMWLYWIALGYVLGESGRDHSDALASPGKGRIQMEGTNNNG